MYKAIMNQSWICICVETTDDIQMKKNERIKDISYLSIIKILIIRFLLTKYLKMIHWI